MDDQDGLYWSSNMLQAVDTRAQYLDLDQTLQGDQYAMIRDLYLQRKAFQIAEKRATQLMYLSLMMTQKIRQMRMKTLKDEIKVLLGLRVGQYLDFDHTYSMMNKVII